MIDSDGTAKHSQRYKVDRIEKVSHKWQKKKRLRSIRCRYLAKSRIVNCDASSQRFDYVNFRGSIFSRMNFQHAVIPLMPDFPLYAKILESSDEIYEFDDMGDIKAFEEQEQASVTW